MNNFVSPKLSLNPEITSHNLLEPDYKTAIENIDCSQDTILSLCRIYMTIRDAKKSGYRVFEYESQLECLLTQIQREVISARSAIDVNLGRDEE